jgi:hypothetical protein
MIKTASKPQSKIEVPPPEPAPQLPAVPSQPPAASTAAVVPALPERHYPGRIAKAILAVSQQIGSIQKTGFNDFQRYKYTRWEDILEKLSPLLIDYKLVVTPHELDCRMFGGDKSSVLAVTYEFVISNEHGEQWPPIRWTAIQRLYDQKGVPDDKAAAKAYTQAAKQIHTKLFQIRSDDSIDAEDERRPQRAVDERATYQKFLDEVAPIHSLVELDDWRKNNLQRVRSALRDHWLGYFNVWFDEKRIDIAAAEATMPDYDAETGEVIEVEQAPHKASSVAGGAAELTTDEADAKLAAAAQRGTKALQQAWENELTKEQRKSLRAALDRRHKINAMKADAAGA